MSVIGWLVGFLLSIAFSAFAMANLFGVGAVIWRDVISPAWHEHWKWWKILLYFLELFIPYQWAKGVHIMSTAPLWLSSYRWLISSYLLTGSVGLALYYWQYHHPSISVWTLWLVPIFYGAVSSLIGMLGMRLVMRYGEGTDLVLNATSQPSVEVIYKPAELPRWVRVVEDVDLARLDPLAYAQVLLAREHRAKVWRTFMKPVVEFAGAFDARTKKPKPADASLGAGREGTMTDAEKAGLL